MSAISRRLATLSLALWGLTAIGAGAWLWRSGALREPEPQGSGDTRKTLPLNARERKVMLEVMRADLAWLNEILSAAERGDLAAIARAARSAEGYRPGDLAPSLRGRLPEDWSALGIGVHREFGALATDAEEGTLRREEIPGRVARITSRCVACHDLYRF